LAISLSVFMFVLCIIVFDSSKKLIE